MTELRYEQLDDPTQAIRLLRVLPYKRRHNNDEPPETDILVCELKAYTRGWDCPKYTALSYAWGNATESRKIMIDEALCSVNATVELALREIRRKAANPAPEGEAVPAELFVWVDQICINQADEVEKGGQVSHMLHIYNEADHVIAWLGAPWPDCGFLFDYFTILGTALIEGDFDSIKDYHKDQPFRNRVARAYYEYCKKLYWARLWVIQEYAVPRNLTIACGPWQLNSEHVYAAVVEDEHSLKEGQTTTREEMVDILRDFQSLYANIPSSFALSIMTRRSGYQWAIKTNLAPSIQLFVMLTTALVLELDYNLPQTTDPRDRVFSLLGLISDRSSYAGLPDYSLSCEDVYQRVAQAMLLQNHVDILAYCQFPKSLTGLPTWAPDWSMKLRAPCCVVVFETEFMASASSVQSQPHVEGGSLILDGVFVDVIKERSDVLWDPDWLGDFDHEVAIRYVSEITRFCKSSSRIRMEDEETDIGRIAIAEYRGQHGDITWNDYYAMIRSGLRTLVGNEIDGGLSNAVIEDGEGHDSGLDDDMKRHASDVATHLADLNVRQEVFPEEERTMLAQDASWFRASMRRLHSRRPFITSTGFVGLGPEATEVGDKVFVLMGAKTPYVLRPTEDGTMYTVVGDAYVHGIMYGEVMKAGPEVVKLTII